MKRSLYIQITMLLLVICLPSLLHAQPNFTDDVVDAPVDGGLSLLIAAGVGFGAKRLKEKRKQQIEK
jgi:hypothetical protein